MKMFIAVLFIRASKKQIIQMSIRNKMQWILTLKYFIAIRINMDYIIFNIHEFFPCWQMFPVWSERKPNQNQIVRYCLQRVGLRMQLSDTGTSLWDSPLALNKLKNCLQYSQGYPGLLELTIMTSFRAFSSRRNHYWVFFGPVV